MLRDRYDPMDRFAVITMLSLAMEPVLPPLDRLLDNDVLFQRVKADLLRRAPHTATRGHPICRQSATSAGSVRADLVVSAGSPVSRGHRGADQHAAPRL
jgi:hypothetical protein